ncbi:MAG: type V CRISPR-associated endonuclease Cas1 [Bacteroidaceae bacterium]|nr:type V CRISPR-associated endonuclease Cas1 [Bacteroidaceae bacterium]
MFTHKDIEYRSIFVINCINERSLRVSNGELLLEEHVESTDKMKTLTEMPFQKILALFIIGHAKITTPLMEKCHKFGVTLVVVKPNFRPVFFWANHAEANFLLHQKQYAYSKDDLSIAKIIIRNKIHNQIKSLTDTRKKDDNTLYAISKCQDCLDNIVEAKEYSQHMGIEGLASKVFFAAYFGELSWQTRRPRTKCDVLNATLDIGYTILFNYIECFLRMFGFDIYIGVYHRLWFKRKSLVCDIMEPFRCIIDKTIRKAFNKQQFSAKDFDIKKGEYLLKRENNKIYSKVFFDALIPYKIEVFKYIQSYYRCFMNRKTADFFPQFLI